MAGKVTAIIPKEFNSKQVMSVLKEEMRKYAPFIVRDYERTVEPWTGDKPTFKAVIKAGTNEISITVRVLGSKLGTQKWGWLDKGTKPHKIPKVPKSGKSSLRFRSGHYSAGSIPGSLHTSSPSPAAGPYVFPKQVNHPGNKPRGWTKLLIRDHQKSFQQWMGAAMKQAAKSSGHAER